MSAKIFISDVHIKAEGDEASELMLKFLRCGLASDVEEIYLVGDVFDIMVGAHNEYLAKYPRVFSALNQLLKENKKVSYIEGNHDFHLEGLFDAFHFENRLLTNKINYVKQGVLVNTNENKTIYVTHGDEIEIDNRSYMIYKNIVNNRFLKLLSDEVLSFKFIESLAEWLSKKSRGRNEQRYESPDMQERIKEKFRTSAEVFTKKLFVDYLVCGHSHVKDQYQCSTGSIYLNNGYAPYTQSYLQIDEDGAKFIDL